MLRTKKTTHSWIIWIVCALFYLYKFVLEVSPNIMTNDLMKSFNVQAAGLGNLAASYFYSYFFMQIPVGLLLDRFGPRKMTTLAIIVCGLGAYLFSQSTVLWEAFGSRFLIGLGAAFAAINALKLTTTWFAPKKFALMTGLLLSVGMVGAVVGQEPLALFIEQFSWRRSFAIIGGIGLLLGAIFFLLVRDAPEQQRDLLQKPSEKIKFSHAVKNIFTNPQNWLLSIYSGLAFAPVSVLGGLWGASFVAKTYDTSPNHAAQIISLMFIGFALGAPFFGWLSDYRKTRTSIMLQGTVLAFIALILFLYVPIWPLAVLSILFFLFGFFISSFLLCFTVVRQINLLLVTATAIGIMNTCDAFFGAISDPIIGALLDFNWSGSMENGLRVFSSKNYKVSLSLLPAYLAVAIILLFYIRDPFKSRDAKN